MDRSKNRNCVYTGKVGRRLRPLTRGLFSSKRVVKRPVRCNDGPFAGATLWLSSCGGLTTLPFVAAKGAGRYVKGVWQATV